MAGLAGCQTRPIAKAHHKTHDDDVRSSANTRGSAWTARDQPGRAFFWVERCFEVHFNHVQLHLRAAGIISGGSHTSAVAPAASRSPSPHAAVIQPLAGSSRNDDAEPRYSSFCLLCLQTSFSTRWRRSRGSYDKSFEAEQHHAQELTRRNRVLSASSRRRYHESVPLRPRDPA